MNRFLIVKQLDFEAIAHKNWDPVFYFLNEIKVCLKHFNYKQAVSECLLYMVDYFVDYDPGQPERSPKIFCVYEDFHCNLRDIIEFRREHKLGFIELHVLKILQDLVSGVNSLHMLGSFE